MKKVELKDFCNYHYLSDLNASPCNKKLLFVESMADVENNTYKQKLWSYDINNQEFKAVIDFRKKFSYYVLGHGDVLITKDVESEFISTTFDRICPKNGNINDTFTLPLAVNSIRNFNDDYYLVSADIDTHCPDYYLMSDEDKKAYHQNIKDNSDYIEFDEYPYVYNGAGFINGNRTALFLVNKKDYSCLRITSPTMTVESFDVDNNKIVFAGNDYDKVKVVTNEIYEYDFDKKETKCLFNDSLQVLRVFYDKGRVLTVGIYQRGFGDFDNGKFYEVKDKKLKLILDNELSLYNSILTDCRYGKLKNYAKFNGVSYFDSCVESNSKLFKFEDDKLIDLCDFTGTVDDFVVAGKRIFVIALSEQNLQEIYELADGKLNKLSSFNDLSEYYVAEPKKINVGSKVDFDAWVLLPENFDIKKKYPAILDIHGGPKCAYGTVYYHEMQYWVNLGYVIMFCDPRGSDGRGNAFNDIRRQYGGVDYDDLMDFVDKVLEIYPNIDSGRLGVTGGSYGGYMTNWIVTQTDRFKCAATQRSISNWVSEVCTSDYGIDFPISNRFADIKHCDQELWALSPLKYANNVKTPLLFIHSTEDYRCTFTEALQFYTAVRLNGVDTKIVAFKGENHELSRNGKPLHRIRRLEEITNWLNKYLMED